MDQEERDRVDKYIDEALAWANSPEGQKKILENLAKVQARCDEEARRQIPSYELMHTKFY